MKLEKQCCEKTDNFLCSKHKKHKLKWNLPSHIDLRKMVMKNNLELSEDEQWQKEIPYDTRQLSLKSLIEKV